MPLPALLRPTRAMAFPFAAVLFPLLWFVYRDATGVDRFVTSLPRILGLVGTAVLASYAAAVVAGALFGPADGSPGRLKPLLAPSNGTLVVVAVVSALLGLYLLGDATGLVPRWLTTVLAPAGIAVGWPMLVAILATYAVGNALGTELPLLVQAAFVAVGIVASVAWLFVLGSAIAAFVADRSASGHSPAS